MSIRKYLQKIRILYIHWGNCVVVPAKNKTKIVAPAFGTPFLEPNPKDEVDQKAIAAGVLALPDLLYFFPGEFGRVAVALFPEVPANRVNLGALQVLQVRGMGSDLANRPPKVNSQRKSNM